MSILFGRFKYAVKLGEGKTILALAKMAASATYSICCALCRQETKG